MDMNRYSRRIIGHFSGTCLLVAIVAFFMWMVTVADVILNLGWGWDQQIIWIAPIICLGALATRLAGHMIFRALGARKP